LLLRSPYRIDKKVVGAGVFVRVFRAPLQQIVRMV
jgi:hypothetical protein